MYTDGGEEWGIAATDVAKAMADAGLRGLGEVRSERPALSFSTSSKQASIERVERGDWLSDLHLSVEARTDMVSWYDVN